MTMLNKAIYKFAPIIATSALAVAFISIGTNCRTFLYQPVVPKQLMEKE